MNRREFLKSIGAVSVVSVIPAIAIASRPKPEYLTFGSDKTEIEKMLHTLRSFDDRLISDGFKPVGKTTVIHYGMGVPVNIVGTSEKGSEGYSVSPKWYYVHDIDDFEFGGNTSFINLLSNIADDPIATKCGVISKFSGVRVQKYFDLQTYEYRYVSDMYIIEE